MKKKPLSPVCANITTLIQTLSHVDIDTIQTVLDQEPSQPVRLLYLYLTFTNATLGQIDYIKKTLRVSPGDFEGEAEVRKQTLAHRFVCHLDATEKARQDFLFNVQHQCPPVVRQAFLLEAQERSFRTKFRSKASKAMLDAIEAMV